MNRREAIAAMAALTTVTSAVKAEGSSATPTETILVVNDRGHSWPFRDVDPSKTCVIGYQDWRRGGTHYWIGDRSKPQKLEDQHKERIKCSRLFVFTGHEDANGARIFAQLNECPMCYGRVVGSIEEDSPYGKYYGCSEGCPLSLITWPFTSGNHWPPKVSG